jgi:hypothetical protein
VEPSDGQENDRQFYRYDRFADQLRPNTSAVVRVVEDDFTTPPADGIILLDRYGGVAARLGSNNFDEQIETLSRLWSESLRRRIFCLNSARGNDALRMLERLGLAGAIDQIDYQVGVREVGPGTAYGDSGLYGLRDVAESLGCTIDYVKDRYCKAVVPPFATLGELLGRYLAAYWSSLDHRQQMP